MLGMLVSFFPAQIFCEICWKHPTHVVQKLPIIFYKYSEESKAIGDLRSTEIWRCASEEKIIGNVIAIVVGGGQEVERPSSRDLASPSSDAIASSRSASFAGDGHRRRNLRRGREREGEREREETDSFWENKGKMKFGGYFGPFE